MMSCKIDNDELQYTWLTYYNEFKQLSWPSTPELYYTLCRVLLWTPEVST